MPAAPADRTRSVFAQRLLALVGGGLLAGVGLVGLVAAPASAEPVFTEGDCVISRVSDAGPGGAQCAGVDLSATRFGEGDFRGANLAGANFAGGDVQGAVFTGADLSGADFTGTRIVGADFTGSSILAGQVDLTADASGSAALPIEANVPAGMTLDGCSIVGTPIESGQLFPIGTSNVLCTLSTSFNGTASLVMTVNVVASATATPTSTPLFTPVAPTGTATAGDQAGEETPNVLMIGGFIGGGLLVVAGIVAFVVSNRRGHSA